MFRSKMLVVCLAAIAALSAGCAFPNLVAVTGSGNLVTEEPAFTDFDRLNVSHAFRVNVRQGDEYSTIITIDDNLLQYLNVDKVGGTLRIGLDPALTLGRATLQAEVTMPVLTGLDLSGASRGTISGFESGESFSSNVSGASRLEGDINAGDARVDASGASQVELEGSAGDVIVNASGASRVDLGDFSASDADVEASGASQVTISADGRLDAEASGASKIFYVGNPTMGDIDTSGASTIQRR